MELMEILNSAADKAKCYTQFTGASSDADRSAQLFPHNILIIQTLSYTGKESQAKH